MTLARSEKIWSTILRVAVEFQIPNNAGNHVRELVNNQRNDHNIYSSGVATERDRFMGSSIDRDAGVSDIGSRLRPATPRANAARYNVRGEEKAKSLSRCSRNKRVQAQLVHLADAQPLCEQMKGSHAPARDRI